MKDGAGRRFALPVRDRLMMLLVYYRMYITYELAGYLFCLDQSNVCRNIKYLEAAVRGSIPIPQKMMYAESKKIGTIQELERYFPEFCVMIDSSERGCRQIHIKLPPPLYSALRHTLDGLTPQGSILLPCTVRTAFLWTFF